MKFKFYHFLITTLLFVNSLHAQTYYVSAYHGNNNNSGESENTAFETISKALSKIYDSIHLIDWPEGYYRKDIGKKALT